ncbi:MAG: aldolase catalytic domain-containing protein, partial [Candidatus Omnitrophota bacterium]
MKMDKLKNNSFSILDCTIRDGGYLNNWRFDKKLVRETYRAVSKSGVEIMEIGYRGTDKYFDRGEYGQWRFSGEELLRDVVSGIHGAKIALMADFGKIEVDDFVEAKDSVIDIIRIAAHKDNLQSTIDLLEEIKGKGYKVSLNAMGYSNYTSQEQKTLISVLKKSSIDFVYVVDSYGSLFPGQIRGLLEPLLEIPHIKVGFHPHNSLQMAFANSLEAIHCGAHLVDSTFYGMGRGAGNLPTEILVLYMELVGSKKYNVLPILNCIDAYFLPLRKEIEWGYQLPFMLSGMYKCHPSYAKALVDFREHTIEDICRSMEWINKQNPVGYSKDLIREITENALIGKARAGSAGAEARKGPGRTGKKAPYADRHKDRDFLILANGPTLKEYKGKIDKFIEAVNPIILGANNLSGLYMPDYHAFNNKKRFMMY